MSGLTKKTVFADRILSGLLGVKEGELVSYAQLSKGIHQYIKDHDLKNPNRTVSSTALPAAGLSEPVPESPHTVTVPSATVVKQCKDCGANIPAEAVFCDLCGVEQ